MSPNLKSEILLLATLAHPTEAERETLIQEWEAYFEALHVELEEEEFNAIMRARILAGGISLRAPKHPFQ